MRVSQVATYSSLVSWYGESVALGGQGVYGVVGETRRGEIDTVNKKSASLSKERELIRSDQDRQTHRENRHRDTQSRHSNI